MDAINEMGERGICVEGAQAASLDPDGLRRAFALLEDWIEAGVLPGAAALVARGGRIAGEVYLGVADRRSARLVDAGTIWSLASITKPFTAAAVMLLVEQGSLSLDEPVYQILPEFLDAPETPFDRRTVTLRHLLSHCSGLPGFSADNMAMRQAHRPLEDFVRSFEREALLFAPGAAHYYSNVGIVLAAEAVGRALDGMLGQRVEQPSIGRYHAFLQTRILAPLGMRSSALLPPPAWDDRIAWVEDTGQEGKDWEAANSRYYRSLGMPWGGLFSRPRELARFVDLFLPGAAGRQRIGLATLDERPELISPATARCMREVQFAPPDAPPDLAPALRDAAARIPPLPAVEWGLGWEIKGNKRPHFSGELTSPETYGHVGASGTMVWADLRADLVCVLLTNRALVSGWTTERPRQALFSNAVMAAAR